MGHRVRLIPPQYVKPFVKRGKNDRNDAEAISEAAARPSMRSVPVKSAEAQAEAMALSVRELLVKQRTQLINALRGHACEFGVISAKGAANAGKLVERVEADTTLPAAAREMFVVLGREIARLDEALRVTSTASSPCSTRPTHSANCSWRFRGSGRLARSP
jgi:transposase